MDKTIAKAKRRNKSKKRTSNLEPFIAETSCDLKELECDIDEIRSERKRGRKEKSLRSMLLSKASGSSPITSIICVDSSSDSVFTDGSDDDNRTGLQQIRWKASNGSENARSSNASPRQSLRLNQSTTCSFFDDFSMLEAATSTALKKRNPSNVSASDLTMEPSLMLNATTGTTQKKCNLSNVTASDITMNPSLNEDHLRTALKEFKFIKNENETWTDANTHTFNRDDITEEDDEKRGTYNLEKSVIDLDTLKSLCENDANISTVGTERKRSSIGQRISKNKSKRSPSPKLSIGFKAKAKLQKFRRSKEHIEGVANTFSTSLSKKCKKSVAFDNTVSSINLCKIKRTKMPNFARIHQRQLQRSESIVDYVERTNERAKLLLSGSKPSTSHNRSVRSPSVARKNLLDSLASEKKEFQQSGSTKSAITPPTLKKKSVTYATPPAVQNRSPKTFAKTPGKNTLGKNPATPSKDTFSRNLLEVSAKTPQKEILNKTPVKLPKSRMHTSSGMISQTSTNSLVQPSTSNPHFVIRDYTLPGKRLVSNTTKEALFATNKQPPSNKTYPSVPKMSRIPIRIKGASSKMSTNQNTMTTATNPEVLRTTTEADNKENEQATVKNVRVGFKAHHDRGVLKVVVANKTRVPKVDNIADRRKTLKGVRSNRRFDLLMKLRSN